jgi:hypothetical protein
MFRVELAGIAGTSLEPYMRERHHKVIYYIILNQQNYFSLAFI